MPLNSGGPWDIDNWEDYIFHESVLRGNAVAYATNLFETNQWQACLTPIKEEYLRMAETYLLVWTQLRAGLDDIREQERLRYRPSFQAAVPMDWNAVAMDHMTNYVAEANTLSLDNRLSECIEMAWLKIHSIHEDLYFLYEEFNALHARRARVL